MSKPLLLFLALCAGHSTAAPKPKKVENTGTIQAVLWRAPGDASRDLCYGSGGHAPEGPFTFLKEDLKGANPKFTVRDREDVKWTVKMGEEARPETAASQLVRAAGYFAPEDYFLPELVVTGLPRHLRRGQKYVGSDGVIRNVRLKRSSIGGFKKTGYWDWRNNPFSDTREMNGLRVAMALINNWDLKDENNAIYEGSEAGGVTQLYLVGDLGSSFGAAGLSLTSRRSKDNLDAYRRSRFIAKVTPEYVDFGVPATPFLLRFFTDPPYFVSAIRLRWIGKRVPRDDVRWFAKILDRIPPAQLRTVFRAAGYPPVEAEGFAGVLQRRIAALNEL